MEKQAKELNLRDEGLSNEGMEIIDKEKYGCYYDKNCNGQKYIIISGEHTK